MKKYSNIGDIIHEQGIIHQAIKQNPQSKQKQKTYKNTDICLTCDNAKCNGNCKKYKEYVKNEKQIRNSKGN